MEPATVL